MIFEIKSPFNLRLEPEFSFSDPVGDPGGTRLEQRCPAFCAIPLGIGEPRDLNLEPIIDELRELHRILYVPSTCNSDVYFRKLPH